MNGEGGFVKSGEIQSRMNNSLTGTLPSYEHLKAMEPEDIGRFVLSELGHCNMHEFNLDDFARGIVERACPAGSSTVKSDYACLIGEGLGFLDRAGMLVSNPMKRGLFYRLSRAGVRAASGTGVLVAVSGQEARTLLHPRVATAALGDLEKGSYDMAVVAAFRELEIAVRERSGSAESAKDVFYKAFGASGKSRGPLTPEPMESGDANSLRELFAGAYGTFRNPSAHRPEHDDPVQTMRLLIAVSALFFVLDGL